MAQTQGTPRSYHGTDAKYALPNDAKEHSRLEAQHVNITSAMSGATIHAPLQDPSRILDIGCGTGVVTCYLAANYPSAQVYGYDLSPVPQIHDKPSNVTFIKGNIRHLALSECGDSRFGPSSQDFVFSRLLLAGMTDWQGYLDEITKMLKPGGYVELQEMSHDRFIGGRLISNDWPWLQAIRSAGIAKGLDLDCGKHLVDYMRNAGLEIVEKKEYLLPSGTWAADKEGREETRNWGSRQWKGQVIMYPEMIQKMLEGTEYSEEQKRRFGDESAKTCLPEDGKYALYHVALGKKPL